MLKVIIKRFLLIIIGILLSLIFLECGLRLAGWTISSYQQYKNNKALRNKSQYTIMCLGESTTFRQYPFQLQQILDEKYPDKFSIIDCGITGTNLETILELLDNNINKYNPNIVICMMGINNEFVDLNNENVNINNTNYFNKSKNVNLKILKLYILLKQHLTDLLQKKNFVFAENISTENNSLFEYAMNLKSERKFTEATKILKKILQNNPNDEIAFNELCFLYYDCNALNEQEIGYKMAIEGLNKNFNYGKDRYYQVLFQKYEIYKDTIKDNIYDFKYYINKAINEELDLLLGNDNMAFYSVYLSIKDYLTNEQKRKILRKLMTNKNDDKYYGFLAINAIEQKDYQKANDYFAKAEEIRLNFPNLQTYNLYKRIIKKLTDNNIKVICMQYPIRNIKTLQEQLKDEYYYDKLTFISNEKIFKDALTKQNYSEIFFDQFAGDFGHCTNLGNTMIAEQVVNILENLLDYK